MANMLRRTFTRTLFATAIGAAAAGPFLSAASTLCAQQSPAKEPEKPLTPETIFAKKFTGKATIELLVGEVHTLNIDSVFMPGKSHTQVIWAKVPAEPAGHALMVIVSREVATHLLQSGIADPAEHFRGKRVRVSGTIDRTEPTAPGEAITYKLRVTSIDQLLLVRAP